MVSRKHVVTSILALAFLLAVSVPLFAKNARDVNLYYGASVKGAHLDSGKYTVRWEDRSSGVIVTFEQKGNVVATVEGKLVNHGEKSPRDNVRYETTANGSRVIREIGFRGSSQAIVFSE